MKKILLVLPVIFLAFLAWTFPAAAQSSGADAAPVVIYMFWGDGCPHCAEAKPALEALAAKEPRIHLRFFEVWKNPDNFALLEKMTAARGFEPHGVPTIFIGDRTWEGYNADIAAQVDAYVAACLQSGACPDAGAGVMPDVAPGEDPFTPARPQTGETITLPLIGAVDLSTQPLFLSTMLIGFVDGVNPCSVWVLTMLLSITLHAGSRKKIITIGLVFLTVTAAIYALFIAGLFTVFSVISFVGWIQVVVALAALFFAAVNIKDYFWYKEGLSFTIADDQKPGLFRNMRRVLDAGESFPALIGATVVMSAGVSLVEFSCTAGFPVVWTNLLVSQKVTPLVFVLLLLVYMIIYQLDEMVIFFTAVFSLKASRLEEKGGRILKLIGGMLMLSLAVVMLVNPAWMNGLVSSLAVFGAALGLTGLVLLLHRVILPRFGIWIGTEKSKPARRR